MSDNDNDRKITNIDLADQILPLRDRITKIETVVSFHDIEFKDIKKSMGELSTKVDQRHKEIIDTLEEQEKKSLDVHFSHYRESVERNTELLKKVDANKQSFEKFIMRWKTATWAFWLTISLTISGGIWVLDVMHKAGIIELNFSKATEHQHVDQTKKPSQTLLKPQDKK